MRIYILTMLLLSSLITSAQKYHLFIGTYTDKGSKGIYVYEFDAATGKAKQVSHTDSISNPSYLAISANGRYVYAVNETGGPEGGGVSAFSFNRGTGRLSFMNRQPSGGDHPCYISVTKNNKWVVVGNYTGGNVAVLPVSGNGSLQPMTQLVQHQGTGPDKGRQEKAHVHAAVLSKTEDRLFVPDLGIDQVMVYPFRQQRRQPVDTIAAARATSESGSGPRHLRFHPNGKFAYLVEELTGTVTVYSYNNGRLKKLQRISSHPSDYKGSIGSADIHVSPDGRFVYASNRGDANNLAIYSVHPATGLLTLKGFQGTLGLTPRNFMIEPSGKFLLVANQNSDQVVVFRRNAVTGLLRDTGERISVSRPVCLQMTRK
jgi:6-phosphogluconolactonase